MQGGVQHVVGIRYKHLSPKTLTYPISLMYKDFYWSRQLPLLSDSTQKKCDTELQVRDENADATI